MTRVFSVVAIVADERGRFLAVSRKDDRDDLGFPGGTIEGNETPDEAVLRALRDETGLVVSRRAVRSALVAPYPAGLCVAFDVLRHKGVPYSKEGAWVGWVHPSRLTDSRNTFRAFNAAVLEHKGIALDTLPPPEEPQLVSAPAVIDRPRRVRVQARAKAPSPQVGYTLEEALFELTGQESFPQQHITFLHGEAALTLCPALSIQQPRLTFDPKTFAAILSEPLLGIKTHLQMSLVPLNLFRYVHSLGQRCTAAIVAVSPHRPPDDWESVSSLIIECLHTNVGVNLRLTKNLTAPDKLVGMSVVISRAASETTAVHLP